MARQFAGGVATDKIVTGYSSHNNSRSYSFWVWRTGAGGGSKGRMFEKLVAGAQVELFYSNGAVLEYDRGWSTTTGVWTIPDPGTGAWHHALLIYDASATANNPVIYIDGTSQTVTRSAAPVGTLSTNTDAYVLGNRANDNARCWDGRLSDFAIYNALLSAADATALAGGARPPHISTANLVGYWPLAGLQSPEPDRVAGNDGTVTGASAVADPTTLNKALPVPSRTYRNALLRR